ncbi:hypothetical protein CMV30_04810 [Nibricoccus aquaticus]|uniref:HTH araC/xylS-type domain-containing protein n=2 Tax=Nibricoccus aquaticus TaxID=2576891 RepID=A0A290QC15_9BACT|nr:hypothetical protein CMV30_04810 [Nibricoccus aquaticus]
MVRRLLRGEMVGGRPEEAVKKEMDAGKEDCGLFARWEKDLQAKAGDDVERIVMLEMEARLRRIALGLGRETVGAVGPEVVRDVVSGRKDRTGRVSREGRTKDAKEERIWEGKKRGRSVGALQGSELNKVEQMACLIAQRYTEALTVEEIGRAVNLHPNYAMGLFRKAFGTTLIDYVTHHRVSHAQRLLATTEEKIVEVAFGSGFNSLSRFNEAFRRACGCTPRSYRASHAVE